MASSRRQEEGFASTRITTATTTQVKVGPAVLKRIVVSTPVSAGTISIIDNTSGTTVTHGVVTSTADLKPFAIEMGYRMANGIRIITAQAQDITVVWE